MNLTLQTRIFLRSLIRAASPMVCLLLLLSVQAHAKNRHVYSNAHKMLMGQLVSITVKGTVVDEQGSAIPGATVKVKNSTKTAVTDVNGAFTLTAMQGNEVLVVSFIGYKTQEVAVDNKTSIKVIMVQTTSVLDEVVVIGFGTQKKRDLTGSVVSVKAEDITARPGPDPIESLQGRVAGLDITRTSGQAGAGVNIQLRGTRSLTASGIPLFIIDGLPGDYSTINANDIESIEVLKDASATAVYGSSGANGVIIITTKSGKAGKMKVDFNTYYGYNGWSVVPKMITGTDYLQAKRDAYGYVYDPVALKWVKSYVNTSGATVSATWQSPADDPTIFGPQRYALYQSGQFVDWAGTLLQKNPATQNYSLAVSGGTEDTKAYVSFNLQNETGQYRGDDYKQYSTSIRLDHKVRSWLSIGANLQASYVVANKAQEKLENALTTDPLVLPYNPDGSINTVLGNNVYNLLLDYQPGVYQNLDNNIKTFFDPYVELRPIKGLTILSRAGVHMDYSTNYRFDGIGSVAYTYTNANIAKASIKQNRDELLQWENILTYNFKVLKDNEFTLTAATSYYYDQAPTSQMTQSNITQNNFEWYNFRGDVNTTALSGYSMWKTMAYIGRINYSYKGKYLLSAAVRHDGSSVLYPTNQWDTFPAISGGWRISEESFMAGTKTWLDDLKLRASWGITGTANIKPYTSQSTVEAANASLGATTQPIYRNSSFLTNSNLGWEKSKTTNLGVDASAFNGRINLTTEYYNTETDGVIFSVLLPTIYGTYTPGANYQTNINIAQTNNQGFEVALNTHNIVTKDFEWSTSVTYSRNREKVLKITDNTDNVANGSYTLMIGQPVNSFRNYKIDGIWQIGEEADATVFNSGKTKPGDLKVDVPGMVHLAPGVYSKQAANGTVTYYYSNLAAAQKFNPTLTAATSQYSYSANDFQPVGHNSPDWSLGFQNQFRYKNFDLSIYTFMRWGQTISYDMMGWYQPNAFAINASPSRTFPASFNYWTPNNPSNDFPSMDITTTTSMAGYTGLNFVDGSFFKVKNITLGYTLPNSIGKRISIQKLRVYGTITNPLVIAKSHFLKDYDPEMNGGFAYPLTKQLVLGLAVTL